MARVLIADDDPNILNLTRVCLQREGHEVHAFEDGAAALAGALASPPELVVLDVMMPGMNGFEVCQALRQHAHLADTPVLLLTARGEIGDKARGFGAGADDYLTKPFEVEELVWRTRALLRRAAKGDPAMSLTVGGVALDAQNACVWVREQQVRLRPLELGILQHLMRHHDRLVSTATLLQEVFGYPPGTGSTAGLRTHVTHLREKLEEDRRKPRLIVNVPGRGYMFRSRPEEAEPGA